MRIAAVTEDGIHISQHFGRALFYVVITVEDGKAIHKEMRPKVGRHLFEAADHSHRAGSCHSDPAAAQTKHRSMAETIADCQVLLAGGMGRGAYESLKTYNIEPVVTDVADIDEAVQLYLGGNLPNLLERLH